MKIKHSDYKQIYLSYTFRKDKPFRLTRSIKTKLSNGDNIVIPRGYCTDFASVPTFLWGIVKPYGEDLIAFIIHDYLYDFGYYQKANGKKVRVNKRFADREMKWQQKSVAISPFRYIPMYWAVKIFGNYDN